MKYYITADVHGFYADRYKALDEAGFFTDPEPHNNYVLKLRTPKYCQKLAKPGRFRV